MKKSKLYNKNYTEFNDSYQLVLPLNLECLIPEDDSVRLLSHILEGLNYTKLYQAYSSVGRKPAVEPKIMFKIVSYAYSQNIYSSRKIEKACKRDINFKWLLQGYKAPDHATISGFRKEYLSNEVIEDLFYQQVNYLAKQNRNIDFVHGIGKRKTKIQKWTEQLREYKERQEKYNCSKKIFAKRNSYSKTDTDATFMHMKDDHMKSGQLKPGDNVQIAVESEYVTGVGIFQDRNDIATLIPMINNMQEKIGHKYLNVIAHSGYESEENYLYLENNDQIPYIKP